MSRFCEEVASRAPRTAESADLHCKRVLPVERQDWAPPPEFAEYVVERHLGGGAMGQVYLARDAILARPVAIKFIATPHPSRSARERFLVEARAAARLTHPNVAAVHRAGDLDGRPYLVSEFVEGQPLSARPTPLPEDEALRLGLGIARGLAEAHRLGVLHRDIKPDNVILTTDGTAKLVDFGLAKLLDQAALPAPSTPASAPSALTVVPTAATRVPSDEEASRPLAAATLFREPEPVGPPSPTDAPVPETQNLPTLETMNLVAPETMNLVAPETMNLEATSTPPPATAATTFAPPTSRNLTRAGAVMGTPDYMSPESWRGEPASPRTDVYALGALIYELLAGSAPFAFVNEEALESVVQSQDPPPLRETAPHVHPRLADIVDRCLMRSAEERYASAADLRDELEHLSFRGQAEVPEGNPFRGLSPFDAQHRATFFGREPETEEITSRLSRKSFVLVTGDSGTGKSSVCRASVLPNSTHTGLGEGRSWAAVSVSPGPNPLTRLAAALASTAGRDLESFVELAIEDPKQATLTMQRSLGPSKGVLCFVDQLEELVTQEAGPEAQAAERFIRELTSGYPGIKVLATARADFLTRLARLSVLGPEIPGAIYLLRPMSPEQIRRVIVCPTHAAGLTFEDDELVEELLGWTEDAESSLPILQFTLSRLWEVRDQSQRMITRAGLETIGGVGGALAQHANRVLLGLIPTQRVHAKAILMRLVGSEGVRVTRTAAELTEHLPDREATLDRLVASRLVALSEDADGSACTLIHDVLLREWATLAQWVNESTEARLIRERLRSAAHEWHRLDREPELLWSGQLLDEAHILSPSELTEMETAFLVASRRRRRWRSGLRLGLALAVPLVLSLVWGGAHFRARARIESVVSDHVDSADAALARARSSETRALTSRAKAALHFHSRRRARGEEAWKNTLSIERGLSSALRTVNQRLEAAVALDPGRGDLRRRFADLLVWRARLAHRQRRFDQRDEFLDRLLIYDEAEERTRAWHAPGSLLLIDAPPDARIRYERYKTVGGRMTPTPVAVSGTRVELPPGSYRAIIEDSALTIYFPFVMEAGEALKVHLRPPSGERRPGFAYIPPGRFSFGSTADEEARLGFFDAPPVHTATTGPFWIARLEVTFADWIEWLETLPPERAEAHSPGMVDDAGLTTGGLHLNRSKGGVWSLSFRPGAVTYTAVAGDPIRYQARKRRHAQDWLKFPVVAVTAVDAQAYADWLKNSGRVPGARLCTEHEWERAARGADAREYPHGFRLNPEDINFDQTYDKRPGAIGLDEVGSHPDSDSPFGVQDLAGNAFEWTTSSLDANQFVLRGGSYFYDAATNRVTNRSVAVPTLRVASVGVRLCASAETR